MLPEIKKILYTTNMGKNTRPVLRLAVSLAKAHNAKLYILHVVEPLTDAGSFMIEAYLSRDMAEQAEDLAKNLRAAMSQQVLDKLRERLERFCAEDLGSSLSQLDFLDAIKVVSGSPAETIVREADTGGMDLIVVGSNAGSLRSALLGSTARKVTLMSHKPVLVVPMSEKTSW